MKFTTSTIFAFAQAALAFPPGSSYGSVPAEGVWQAPAPDAERGPCPMMNTLANHGFLPRDGKNLTRENVMHGLNAGIAFNKTLAGIMWDTQAHIANPEPNATFFTLGQLNVHNLLEHDASLTRTDDHFGNNHIFNQTIFDQTKRFWPEDTITIDHLANSKVYRQLESKAFNPEYRFTNKTEPFSLGELAAPILALGDIEKGIVDKKLVEYWIENERLPYELGWEKKTEEVSLEQTMFTSERIGVATSLFTVDSSESEGQHAQRSLNIGRDGHFGF